MAGFPTFKGGVRDLDLDLAYCIPSCITYRPLPTCQILLKLKKLFGTDGRTHRRTDGH